jgi:long-subunit acyl-CoA synthetase (AMP-forming)
VVSNICIYGEASRSFVVALVCPVPEKLRALADRLPNKADMEFEALCKVHTQTVLNKSRQTAVFPDP